MADMLLLLLDVAAFRAACSARDCVTVITLRFRLRFGFGNRRERNWNAVSLN
jgi:hypothetical protein